MPDAPSSLLTQTSKDDLSLEALFSLKGKTAIVTGASSGLGETLALTLAAAGATVVATARREERLKYLASLHPNIKSSAGDVTADDYRAELIKFAKSFGTVDVLVNCAGIVAGLYSAEEEPADAIARTMDVNLIAPFKLCQAVQPGMRERGYGAIVNIASISGVVGVGRIPQASYVASKSGLVGLTRELALQWARYGIRVNAIACGYFRSEITAPMWETPKLADWVTSRQPLKMIGEPINFAGTVLLLASKASSFITGQTFNVDGGWTAQ